MTITIKGKQYEVGFRADGSVSGVSVQVLNKDGSVRTWRSLWLGSDVAKRAIEMARA